MVIKDIVTIPSNSRRFFLATFLFIFHKFTGTDSLNYFAPEIFEMIGVQSGSLSLLTTGVYGLVKLATTIIYVAYIVDRVGRRRPLLVSAPTILQHLFKANENLRLVPCFKRQRCCTLLCTSDLRSLTLREAHQLEGLWVSFGFTFTPLDGKSISHWSWTSSSNSISLGRSDGQLHLTLWLPRSSLHEYALSPCRFASSSTGSSTTESPRPHRV